MTTAPKIESESPRPNPTNVTGEAIKPSNEDLVAFATRIFNAFEKTMTDRERLSCLYTIDRNKFEEELEEEIDGYLSTDPDYWKLLAELIEARKHGGGDSLKSEIESHHIKARELIFSALDLPENAVADEKKHSIEQATELTKDVPKGSKHIDEALKALGCRVELKDGLTVDTYPYELMPHETNVKWENYLESVNAHIVAAENSTPDTRHITVSADRTRTIAHNSVKKDVHEILGLDQFGYQEDDVRLLLGRMRDTEMALIEAGHPTHVIKSGEEIAIAKYLSKHKYGH